MVINSKAVLTLLICFAVLLVSAFAGICFGGIRLNPSEVINGIIDSASTADGRIIYCVRIPRVIAAMLSGAALAVSGAIIQAVLSNPLAAPNIIGVNSGAGFFTVLCMAVFPARAVIYPVAAFIGALTAVMLVYFIAKKAGVSKTTLILTGVAISSLFNASTDTVISFFPDTLSGISAFKIGGISGITLDKLTPAWIFILVGIVLAWLLSSDIDVITLGDRVAFTLGMNVNQTRFLLLVIAALLAGAAVSIAGILGFVGLIVPHIATKIIGSGNVYRIPACALMGAAFVTICDTLSRTLFAPYEIALGIIISYIGVPFFIYLLFRKKGGKHNA